MKFIDLFAGIGGFRRGMELAGHECVGFCEIDNFATASYISMHLLTDEQRKYLSMLDLKKRQKEILKDEYRNGEWYTDDIGNVEAATVPKCDCWCFGAPCQDFSIAGKRAGLDGGRSILVREVFRLLREIREKDRPEWLIYENVKGMLSSNRGFDFLSILLEMDELGYDCEWQIINSKDWGVPQNRERVYTVGHLRSRSSAKIFPVTGADGENSVPIELIAHHKSYRRNTQVFSPNGITETLSACQGGGREHHVAIPIGYNTMPDNTCRTLKSQYQKNSGVNFVNHGDRGATAVAILISDPNNSKKSKNGKQDVEMMEKDTNDFVMGVRNGLQRHQKWIYDGTCPTLTAAMGMGGGYTPIVEIPIKNKQNITDERCERSGNELKHIDTYDAYDHKWIGTHEIRTLTTNSMTSTTHKGTYEILLEVPIKKHDTGLYVKLTDDCTVYAVWYEKYECYVAIRKLTPKECFRLQGWTDDYFERAKFVNSDSQLYKQAGNGVTVNVVYEIGKRITEAKK